MTTLTYGATDLSTFGNITVLDDLYDLPERRGDNKVIPFRHGTSFSAKFYQERTLSVGMAILGTSLSDLESKLNTLRGLFSDPLPQTLSVTYEDATTKTAQVTVDRSLEIQRTQSLARIVVEFTLCEPFFRLSTLIADNTTAINASPKAMVVTNPGTIEERDPTIVIHGAFTSLTITNTTNNTSLTYTGAIGTGETVTIGTLNGEYYATLSTGSTNVIGNVTHSGSSALLPLDVGSNSLSITNAGRDANSTVKVSFYAPYL
jgi:phage-related protein